MFNRYICTFILFLIISVPVSVQAEMTTYYVANNPGPGGEWGNGSDSNDGLSKATPFLTMKNAITNMSGGDILIIADGTYTGDDNMISYFSKQPPDGSNSAYTTIKAENEGEVILDGEGVRKVVYILGDDTIDEKEGIGPSCDYIEIRGIISANSVGSGIFFKNAKYIKIINCGAVDPADGNETGIMMSYCSYTLVEGCYAWGGGRYKFGTYHSDHCVFRNLIARMDRADPQNDPVGEYSMYQSTNCEVQNCIAIDGDQPDYVVNVTNYAGSFAVPMTYPDTNNDGPVNFTNCIGLNVVNRFGTYNWNADKPCDAYVTNCTGWNYTSPDTDDFLHSQGHVTINHSTFGEVNTEGGEDVTDAWFNGYKGTNSTKNTIYYNFKNGGLFKEVETSNYNNIIGLDDGYNIDVYNTTSENTITIDPKTNGLKYLTRIEPGASLAFAGEGGTYIGANILYQYGKSGTMWGEDGYNKLQDGTDGQDKVLLWPFPNEDLIREKMAAYTYDDGSEGNPEIVGNRGFCATGETLTNYIWGQLGNTLPPFNVVASPGNKKAYLSWDANTYDTGVTGYKVYKGDDSGTYELYTTVDSSTTNATVTGLTNDEDYFFVITTVAAEESGYSYEVSATPKPVEITSPSSGFYVNADNDDSYTVSGTADAGSTVEIFAGDVSLGEVTADDTTGVWSKENVDFSGLSEGSISLTAVSVSVTSPAITGTYDRTVPGSVSGVSSSPEKETWSNDNTVTVKWTAATDAVSGLEGYSILWNTEATTTPEVTQNLDAVTTTTSSALEDGDNHYFHIRAVDKAGNWGSAVHYGPFYIDTTATDAPVISTNGGNGAGVNYTTTSSSITLSGTCASDTANIYINGSTTGVTYTAGETSWSYSGTLEVGRNAFDITAKDAAGNTSSAGSITVIYRPEGAIPPEVVSVNPHDGAGIDDDIRVANNASFSVRFDDTDGIDVTDPTSVQFTIYDGTNSAYEVDLGDTTVVKYKKLDDTEADTAVTDLWVVYHRSKDEDYNNVYPFEAEVNVKVDAKDNQGYFMDQAGYDFKIESESANDTAAENSPETSAVTEDLDDTYDTGIEVTSGDLAGAQILYNSADVVPTLGPSDEIPTFEYEDNDAVGVAMNLQPPTTFSTPVKIFVPCPDEKDVSKLSIFMYNGEAWVLACDADGNVQEGGDGWMVVGSRQDHNDTDPPTIEIQVYHFTGVIAGTIPDISSGTNDADLCFIATAVYGSPFEGHVEMLIGFIGLFGFAGFVGLILLRHKAHKARGKAV